MTRKSHHYQTSVIYLVQSLFSKLPSHRTISLNSQYIILFKSPRDSSQISHLAKQIMPGDTKFVVEAYTDATVEPYSYLLMDFRPQSSQCYRLRSSIFPNKAKVYVSSSFPVYKALP